MSLQRRGPGLESGAGGRSDRMSEFMVDGMSESMANRLAESVRWNAR